MTKTNGLMFMVLGALLVILSLLIIPMFKAWSLIPIVFGLLIIFKGYNLRKGKPKKKPKLEVYEAEKEEKEETEEDIEEEPEESDEEIGETRFCEECEEEVPADSKYCPKCGAEQ